MFFVRFSLLPKDVSSTWSGSETQQLPFPCLFPQRHQTHRFKQHNITWHLYSELLQSCLNMSCIIVCQGRCLLWVSLAEVSLAQRCDLLRRRERTSHNCARYLIYTTYTPLRHHVTLFLLLIKVHDICKVKMICMKCKIIHLMVIICLQITSEQQFLLNSK